MTVIAFQDTGSQDRAPARAELSRVALRVPRPARDGRVVPAGATGTVVDVLAKGRAYIVEFARPFSALITVEARYLENASEG